MAKHKTNKYNLYSANTSTLGFIGRDTCDWLGEEHAFIGYYNIYQKRHLNHMQYYGG